MWQRLSLFRQLRFWGEMTAVTVVLIPLALTGADVLWRRLAAARETVDRYGSRLVWRPLPSSVDDGRAADGSEPLSVGVARPVLWGLLLLSLWRGAADPWSVNRRLWHTPPCPQEVDDLLAWLRDRDDQAYFIENNDNVIYGYASVPHIRYGMQVLSSSWMLRPKIEAPDGARLVPAPKYVLHGAASAPPPGATVLHATPGGTITAGPPGLPFAFVGAPSALPYGPGAAATAVAERVAVAARARFDGPNRLVVEVPAASGARLTTLVIFQTAVPGWRAQSADGTPRRVSPAGGFLSIAGVRPGDRYILAFTPPSLFGGTALSVTGLAIAELLFAADWTGAGFWGRSAVAALRGLHPAARGQLASAAAAGGK